MAFAEAWQAEHDRQLKLYGDALASRMGPPPGGQKMSDSALAEQWNQRDPSVTPDKVASMQAQGTSPEDITRAIYPQRENTYTIGFPDTTGQIKEADRIAKMAQKSAPTSNPTDLSAPFLAQSLAPLMGGQQPLEPVGPPPPSPGALTVPGMGAQPTLAAAALGGGPPPAAPAGGMPSTAAPLQAQIQGLY